MTEDLGKNGGPGSSTAYDVANAHVLTEGTQGPEKGGVDGNVKGTRNRLEPATPKKIYSVVIYHYENDAYFGRILLFHLLRGYEYHSLGVQFESEMPTVSRQQLDMKLVFICEKPPADTVPVSFVQVQEIPGFGFREYSGHFSRKSRDRIAKTMVSQVSCKLSLENGTDSDPQHFPKPGESRRLSAVLVLRPLDLWTMSTQHEGIEGCRQEDIRIVGPQLFTDDFPASHVHTVYLCGNACMFSNLWAPQNNKSAIGAMPGFGKRPIKLNANHVQSNTIVYAWMGIQHTSHRFS